MRHPEIVFRPPAARGDILRAVEEGATAIGLVDGYFGDSASVWHKEILFALDHSVAVAGGGSMGALRAAECALFGMVGIGSIFEDYRSGRILDDEAVALMHGPAEMEWMPLSVPRVDYDATIDALERHGIISASERDKLLLTADFMHYSTRTYRNVMDTCTFWPEEKRQALLNQIKIYKVERKRSDAHAVLDWLVEGAFSGSSKKSWTFAPTSQWEMLRTETLEAGVTHVS
jgi:hypothetical protein